MERTVWKFPLERQYRCSVEMPQGAELLHVGVDGLDAVCVWALVSPLAPTMRRAFDTYGTGGVIDDPGQATYVGTARVEGSTPGEVFFWHVFERAT